MQYTKKFDRLLFLRPDFFKVDLFFFLKTFCYGKRGCIRIFISMQPRFGTLECLRCKVPMMKTTGVYCRKRLDPNINSNVADSFDLPHILLYTLLIILLSAFADNFVDFTACGNQFVLSAFVRNAERTARVGEKEIE